MKTVRNLENVGQVEELLLMTKNISFFYRKGILNKSLSFL